TIQGDYNFWFLPQQEDRMNTSPGGNPGPTAYYAKYRPVFEAAPPGQPVSPDLAGRFAADLALGAQLSASTDPPQAGHMLSLARGVYAMAKTPANFTGLGTVSGMRACSAGNFAPFNTATAGYEDNVVSWPSVEPADDYTAASLLAFALGAADLG
ncbi:MAG: hypothetical protein ACRDOB_18665, partial [Streptosporangiaceae bacterium]